MHFWWSKLTFIAFEEWFWGFKISRLKPLTMALKNDFLSRKNAIIRLHPFFVLLFLLAFLPDKFQIMQINNANALLTRRKCRKLNWYYLLPGFQPEIVKFNSAGSPPITIRRVYKCNYTRLTSSFSGSLLACQPYLFWLTVPSGFNLPLLDLRKNGQLWPFHFKRLPFFWLLGCA